MNKHYLVTGAAGFIGYHTCQQLLATGHQVTGIDNLNSYYDVQLKHGRLAQLQGQDNFTFIEVDLADRSAMQDVFARQPDIVINLAAQAGVRYSIDAPEKYIDSNLVGFANVLEGCRQQKVEHLVYASSSSVYGNNQKIPFSESDAIDHPISLYAATKRANELMAHTYAHLYDLPCTGLRFFTVYGPWGRPDMAYFKFTKAILAGESIDIYNNGVMRRDFTYIDDIVHGVLQIAQRLPTPNELHSPEYSPSAPFRVYNIGNNQPVELMHMIRTLEEALGVEANKNMLPMQPGDVAQTYADVDALNRDAGFKPSTSIESGLHAFVAWYRAYYS